MWSKYTLRISSNTIKAILRRHGIRRKKRKVRENLLPFEQMQVDTKYILDQDSLPREIYEHIKRFISGVSVDVATRANFMALSYELSSFFGAVFLTLVLL